MSWSGKKVDAGALSFKTKMSFEETEATFKKLYPDGAWNVTSMNTDKSGEMQEVKVLGLETASPQTTINITLTKENGETSGAIQYSRQNENE